MPRKLRRCPGGLAYHIINRATARRRIFDDADDYAAFERVLAQARERSAGGVRVCAYVLMPNHFHLVLWPREDGAVSRFMKWLTLTHAQRWHAHRHSAGTGALYGSRFKSFAVREDEHFLKVCRYVERNPLRAGLVVRAEHWPWCSLHKREAARRPGDSRRQTDSLPPDASPDAAARGPTPGAADLLDAWPVDRGGDWVEWVNRPETPEELAALRTCVRRERPFGDDAWSRAVARRLGSEQSLRPRGRPKSQKAGEPATAARPAG